MYTKSPKINQNNPGNRRKRIQRMKIYIVTTVIILLLLPTILCLILFAKINKMEKEIQILRVIHESDYEAVIEQTQTENKKSVAHAAVKEDVLDTEQEDDVIEIDNNIDVTNYDELSESTHMKENLIQKNVYLTFDDGPSIYTEEILDILKENQIKATFFVVGKTDDYSISMYKRIVQEGHTLGMHSFSHRYHEIYQSTDNFMSDLDKLSVLLQEVTGEKPRLFRFPGGSSNEISKDNIADLIRYLNEMDITYYDWNVINGDATGEDYTIDELVNHVMKGVEGKNTSVVLMHDAANKLETVESLQQLIESLVELDYNILPIDENTKPIQHIKAELFR